MGLRSSYPGLGTSSEAPRIRDRPNTPHWSAPVEVGQLLRTFAPHVGSRTSGDFREVRIEGLTTSSCLAFPVRGIRVLAHRPDIRRGR